jgi:glycosyltransferase involved in cell wall biosynthesis
LKISIITVCKNPGESIKRTVESVLSQTYKDIEYIIVDGASTDGTVEGIRDAVHTYTGEHAGSPLLKFVSEPDTGIYNAMNKGIGLATGDFLLFLNAGDYLVDGDVISKVVENIEKDGGLYDIYFGDIISEDPATMARYQVPNRLKNINSLKLFFWTVPHAAAFIKKDALTKVGGYDESFKISADYDFFVKAFVAQKMKFNHISLNVSIFQTDGISSDPRNSKLLKNENLWIIKKYYGTFPAFIYNIAPVLVVLRFIYKVWLKLEKDH